jgi:tRNA A58 N-methylase Trm61
MFLLYAVITILFILMVSAGYAGFRAAPWVPTWGKDFERIVRLAGLKTGETVYELGAGEGRLLLQFAKTPAANVTGFEISLVPYAIAWLRVLRIRPRVSVLFKDFFTADFGAANVIFCFLTPPAMRKLKQKFEAECAPGTRIISYSFSIPGWTPQVMDKPKPNAMAIYRYVVGGS